MNRNKYFTIGTLRGCDIFDMGGHVKTVKVVRVGYANDTLDVSCSCGGQWKALTYAKKKKDRR